MPDLQRVRTRGTNGRAVRRPRAHDCRDGDGDGDGGKVLSVIRGGKSIATTDTPAWQSAAAVGVGDVFVLVPAHNEEAAIEMAMASVDAQSHPVTHRIVVADNCTDATETLVRARPGWECWPTTANTAKKAGGLNQAWRRLRREHAFNEHDFVLVMDGDSRIDPDFIATAGRALRGEDVGAVGGVFYGDGGGGLLGELQRNEYQRYARAIGRRRERWASVLTGTATMFRGRVWFEISAARGAGRIPGTPGEVYDTLALTEDNEITIATKTLGWKAVSPDGCRVYTEVMKTPRELWRQRIRWQRGALENIRHYGLTRVTARYAGQQAMIAFGLVAMWSYLVVTAMSIGQPMTFAPFWLGVGMIFIVERIVTVRRRGWRAMLLALPLVLEAAYDVFQQIVFLRSVLEILTGKKPHWGHNTTARFTPCTEMP
jgi:biofilm PGA synthesis N-glycosyltransferase PgaC